ncbi:MAG: lactonase family protein, partial [Chloroflexales bacterium]|nr:lactonase family protein [Chloroflexales bacterium]
MKGKFVRWATCLLLIVTATLTSQLTPARAQQAQTSEREFLYVLEDRSAGSNRIHGYLVDGATGQLASLGPPVETGRPGDDNYWGNVQRLAFHPGTRRLFALNGGDSNTLSAYRVNTTTGALTPDFTVSLGTGAWGCVAVHPSGSPVVVGGAAAPQIGRVRSYLIDASGAHLAPGSPADAGAAIPYSCRFSQDGRYLYAGGYGETIIAGFQVDSASGAIAPLAGSPFNAGVSYP